MAHNISDRIENQRDTAAHSPRKDRRWVWAALITLVALVMMAVSALALNYNAQLPGMIRYPNLQHGQKTGPVSYAQSPPVGGLYAPQWQNCGFYKAPVQNETAVHTLARGAVWITYRPDLAVGDIGIIQRLVRNRSYVLVSPYADQAAPIVATAWGAQMDVYDPEDNRLALFIVRYSQGEQAPEPGQPCTGGIGTPQR
jgi:hypothetical protein